MNTSCSLQPQVFTLFDNSPTFIRKTSSGIPRNETDNKFDDQSSDYNIKSAEYSEEPDLNPESSSNGRHAQKRKFSVEEDNILRRLIEINGPRRWNQIALSLPGRTGRQCRDRFQNYLNPLLINGPWSHEEDILLEQKVYELGQHWNKIARFFKGRSSNNVKNRWYTYICKKGQDQFHQLSRSKMIINKKQYNYNIGINNLCDNHLNNFNEANYINYSNNYYYNIAFNYSNNPSNSILLVDGNDNQNIKSTNTLNYANNNKNNLNIYNNLQNPKKLKKILFPPIYPPDNIMILPSNKGLFNFLSQSI